VSEPIVVKPSDVEERTWPGGGKGRKMITPDFPGSKNLMIGIICADPGKSPHRWHTHTVDRGEKNEIVYPENFEEAYFIIKGKGNLTWKANGEEKDVVVEEGDAIYFPMKVAEHQVLNTGDEQLILLFVGTPSTYWRALE